MGADLYDAAPTLKFFLRHVHYGSIVVVAKVRLQAGAEIDVLSNEEWSKKTDKMVETFAELLAGEDSETITKSGATVLLDSSGTTKTLPNGGQAVYDVPVGYDGFLTRMSVDYEGSNASSLITCDLRIVADSNTPSALRFLTNQIPNIFSAGRSARADLPRRPACGRVRELGFGDRFDQALRLAATPPRRPQVAPPRRAHRCSAQEVVANGVEFDRPASLGIQTVTITSLTLSVASGTSAGTTSLSVNATTYPMESGSTLHSLNYAAAGGSVTAQTVTLSADVAVGATTLSVSSFTPSMNFASAPR